MIGSTWVGGPGTEAIPGGVTSVIFTGLPGGTSYFYRLDYHVHSAAGPTLAVRPNGNSTGANYKFSVVSISSTSSEFQAGSGIGQCNSYNASASAANTLSIAFPVVGNFEIYPSTGINNTVITSRADWYNGSTPVRATGSCFYFGQGVLNTLTFINVGVAFVGRLILSARHVNQ